MASSANAKAPGCDFCKIARGEDNSAEVICSEERWLAFFPLSPATLGHTLVIPRMHIIDLWKANPAQGAELMMAAIKVGRAIESALAPEGMNLITSAGIVAEQTVPHLHLHLVPRWRHDNFGPIWPHREPYGNSKLSDAARRVRHAYADLL